MTLTLQEHVWQQYIQASGRKTVPEDDSFNRKFFEGIWGPAKGAEAAATWAWSFRTNFANKKFSLSDLSSLDDSLLQKLQRGGASSANLQLDVIEKAVYDALQLLGVQFEKYGQQPEPEATAFGTQLKTLGLRMKLSLEAEAQQLSAVPMPTRNFLLWLYHVLELDPTLLVPS